MKKEELFKYWIDSSNKDFQAMIHLLEKGDFTWSLFIGHIVIEKLLKAWYVQNISNTPPFIHDLVRLAEKGNLPLDEDQKDIFDTISAFNLRARAIINWSSTGSVQDTSLQNGLIISRSSENG